MTFPPTDGPDVQYEFFAPFAHVPGRFEWCRIRSPSHGVFDTFIVLGATTADPACVYVNSEMGQAFMRDRFPECTTIRVAAGDLRIAESAEGRTVTGFLRATEGVVRVAEMALVASAAAFPTAVSYGGDGAPVWGGRWTCWGVDLNLPAKVTGRVVPAEGNEIPLQGVAGVVTLGSFGRLAPL